MNGSIPKLKPHSAFSIRRSALLPPAAFLALALAWLWPVPVWLTTRIAHDLGDPVLNTWILWWNTQAMPFTERWWNPPFFYPAPNTFALSEHLFGIAVFTAPLHFAGLSPAGAYNVALILSAWLSGYFAFLLGRQLTGSTLAGLIAGMAFGFCPYRVGQLSHLQVVTSQWMPLALYAMHVYLDDRRRRWLALFAIAWVLQAFSNGYFLLFFPVFLALWLAWFVPWKTDPRPGLVLAATFALSSLLLLPSLLKIPRSPLGDGACAPAWRDAAVQRRARIVSPDALAPEVLALRRAENPGRPALPRGDGRFAGGDRRHRRLAKAAC